MLEKNYLIFFSSYTDVKKKYPIQVNDLRFYVDQCNPRQIQLFEGNSGATNNGRLSVIIIRHK